MRLLLVNGQLKVCYIWAWHLTSAILSVPWLYSNTYTTKGWLIILWILQDVVIEHLLCVLDSQSDENRSECLLTNSNHRSGNLKERLSKYIINVSKSDSLRFVEYWVPVQISNIQLEQYCCTLLSNHLPLFSSSKNDPVGTLRDILISIRKVRMIGWFKFLIWYSTCINSMWYWTLVIFRIYHSALLFFSFRSRSMVVVM